MAITTDDPKLQELADRYTREAGDRCYVSMFTEEGVYIDTYGSHPGMENADVIVFLHPDYVEVSAIYELPDLDGKMGSVLGDEFRISHETMLAYLQTLPKPLFEYDITRSEEFTNERLT